MTQPEFDAVTALAHVRTIRAAVDALDTFAGSPAISDAEHAAMRVMAREWERKIQQMFRVRSTPRTNDAQGTLKEQL